MNFYELAAIIGALAWLQQPIINFIRNKFIKPKLEIIVHDEIEIGYNTLGPILNLNLAFSVSKMDTLINSIEIEMIHDTQAKHDLKWVWFEEKLLEMIVPDNFNIPYKKNQIAIALKLSTENLIEKKIGFQSIEYKKKYKNLINLCNEEFINLSKNKSSTQMDSGKNYNDFINLFRNSFFWKIGEYKTTIKVYLTNLNEPITKDFNFNLTNIEISQLEMNINICNLALKNQFIAYDPDLNLEWKWINTSIK